jgi:large subunit ribosomal protein L3
MSGGYDDKGRRLSLTELQVLPSKVESLRTMEKNGYNSVRLQIINGKKAIYREVRTDEVPELGTEIKFDELLHPGDKISVSGISKGKGFAGVVKKFHFAGGPRTHGQSDRERAPGSSGSTTTPGRVYKGKRRAGHMGVEKVTVKNLVVHKVDIERRVLLIEGSVPGTKGNLSLLMIKRLK